MASGEEKIFNINSGNKILVKIIMKNKEIYNQYLADLYDDNIAREEKIKLQAKLEMILEEIKIISEISKEENSMSNKTFKDLYEYIQTAERDEVGMHQTKVPSLTFHIYESKKEINIGEGFDSNGFAILKGKVYFEDDRIMIYRISNGVTDYDHGFEVSYDTIIADEGYLTNPGIREQIVAALN